MILARRENSQSKISFARKILTENPIIKTQIFNQVKAKSGHLFNEGESDMAHYDADGTTIRPKVNQLVFDQYANLFLPIDEDLKVELRKLEAIKRGV